MGELKTLAKCKNDGTAVPYGDYFGKLTSCKNTALICQHRMDFGGAKLCTDSTNEKLKNGE